MQHYRSTELYTIYSSFLCFDFILKNLLNKSAKFNRGKTSPNWDAKISCQTPVRTQPAELGRHFPPPKSDAILAPGIDLPE
jgi:hypothetical protein